MFKRSDRIDFNPLTLRLKISSLTSLYITNYANIRKLPYKEFVIFNLKLKDHQLQVNSFIKSNFP